MPPTPPTGEPLSLLSRALKYMPSIRDAIARGAPLAFPLSSLEGSIRGSAMAATSSGFGDWVRALWDSGANRH